MAIKEITSGQNPLVKQIIGLRDRRQRDKSGLFLIEGYRELLRAVEAGRDIAELLFCEELFLGSNEQQLIASAEKNGAALIRCNESVFRKISYRDRPDGLLAVAKTDHHSLTDIILPKNHAPFFVAAEAIEKPGNLGTILRSADAAHIDGFILCDPCTDLHNPNVVRASVGTLFTVPVFEAASGDTLAWCKKNKIQIVAATPAAEKIYTKVDLTGPILIALGTEQLGLSKLWLDEADIAVKIPMLGQADSLNVATAATLLMFEVIRQRSL
jgi:TrmH family RNA methyltransferase